MMSNRIAACVVAALALSALPNFSLADGPATQPSGGNTVTVNPQQGIDPKVTFTPAGTQPAAANNPPATAPSISPDARAVIDQSASAYQKLKGLELAGTMTFDVDGGGEKVQHTIDFTDVIGGHDRFRHDGKDDATAGANSKTQYLYQAENQQYLTGPAAPADADVDDLMDPLPEYLRHADPSLLYSLSNTPASLMLENATDATKAPDTKLDSQSYPTVKLVQTDKSVVTMLFDPTTHLLKRVQTDLKPVLVAGGQQVDHALITIDYTKTTPNAQIKPDAFDWTPPAGAQEMPDQTGAAGQLRGKQAPDFSLTYLDGKPVSLADFKGKVVVLDFWATWCGPCRESMPTLEALYQAKKAEGLHVLAVDAGEENADVNDFVDKTKLSIPVVMDPDSKGRDAYQIEGYPTKIVIGKDGIITTVIVGAGPGADRKLDKAVAAALAK